MWASGIKASGHTTEPHPDSDNLPGRNYENLELLNRPVVEDNKQVVCMNSKVVEKQATNQLTRFYVKMLEMALLLSIQARSKNYKAFPKPVVFEYEVIWGRTRNQFEKLLD